MVELKLYKVNSVSQISKPNSVFFVKGANETETRGFVTTKDGIPVPFKDLNSGTGSGITTLNSLGGTIEISGTSTIKNLEIEASLLALINSALQSGDPITSLVNNAGYITLSDVPTFNPLDYDLEDFNNASSDPFARQSDLSVGGATDLAYTPSPTNGIVTSSTGTDATIPLADDTNAGLLKPSKFTLLESIQEAFTTALKTAYDGVVTWVATNGTNILNHIVNTSNPHSVTATQVGAVPILAYTPSHSVLVQQSGTDSPTSVAIGNNEILGRLSGGGSDIKGLNTSEVRTLLSINNVDNTSDVNKPISTATQTALTNILKKFISVPSASLTGVTSQAVIATILIPANTYDATDAWQINIPVRKTATASNVNFILWHGLTTGATTTQVGILALSTINRTNNLMRNCYLSDGNMNTNTGAAVNSSSSYVAVNSATVNIPIDNTVDNYFTLTGNPSVVSEVLETLGMYFTPLKY